jgi:hypothetical protein
MICRRTPCANRDAWVVRATIARIRRELEAQLLASIQTRRWLRRPWVGARRTVHAAAALKGRRRSCPKGTG